jgi:sterol desaturase/sphingolipid hydroxylase (fatty acid hydroxylase superfamily)
LHHKSIYKYIHKKHHTFKESIGIASEYAHPVEDVLANTIPTIGGCLVMGSHVAVLWIWLAIRVAETVDAHSGYRFPLSPFAMLGFQGGAERHDFHHSHNVGCYGSFTVFWDQVMGTDAAFLEYKKKQLQDAAKEGGHAKAS